VSVPFVEAQKPNVPMGILYGIAAGIVGGGIWWAIVFFAHIQFVYGALGVGALIAYGVLEGARIPGRSAAVISVAIAMLTVLSAEYFIVRSLAVQEIAKSGDGFPLPVWLGFATAGRLIKVGIEESPISVGFWLMTVFVAGRMGLRGGNRHNRVVRRPDVPWTPRVPEQPATLAVPAPLAPPSATLASPVPPPPSAEPFAPPSPPR
jgi:hypothetical protein